MSAWKCEMIARVPGNELPANEAQESADADTPGQLDPVDVIRGLAAMDALIALSDRVRADRLRVLYGPPTTAAARHLLEKGHGLTFGCCSRRPAIRTHEA